MEQNIFHQVYYKIIQHLYQLKMFQFFTCTTEVYFWKYSGVSVEAIENITTISQHFSPTWINSYPLPYAKFNGHPLINNNISVPKKVINIYISYTLDTWKSGLNKDFNNLNNYLCGSVKLTKNADSGKCKYSGYDSAFDSHSEHALSDSSVGKNAIIFGADMSSSVHIDNKN